MGLVVLIYKGTLLPNLGQKKLPLKKQAHISVKRLL